MRTKQMSSLGAMASHLLLLDAAIVAELKKGLRRAANAIEQTSKEEIGHYQKATEAFPAWAPLAEFTKNERERLGYTRDDPGLRSGAMRDSIKSEFSGLEAVVGSDDQHLVYFELGTDKQPPRSVLGMAVMRNRELIQKELGKALVRGIVGKEAIGGDYDF
nr:MAG TPA: virion morphogenesis protein [Herelleviridae sp.]